MLSQQEWCVCGVCFVQILTTVGFIRVIPAVVHTVALPLQANANAVGTLERVGVAHFAKF